MSNHRDAAAGGERIRVLRPSPSAFGAGPKLEKLMIGSLDDLGRGIEAQFNPKELAIDQTVPWHAHKQRKSNSPRLEFSGGDGRTMTLELLFDGYETGKSVEPMVLELASLGNIRDHDSSHEDRLRPHRVAVVFGGGASSIRPFKGVIQSISTKYTMFLPDGTPVRATCSVKLKETDPRTARRARHAG